MAGITVRSGNSVPRCRLNGLAIHLTIKNVIFIGERSIRIREQESPAKTGLSCFPEAQIDLIKREV
jgi:hypothetical protein